MAANREAKVPGWASRSHAPRTIFIRHTAQAPLMHVESAAVSAMFPACDSSRVRDGGASAWRWACCRVPYRPLRRLDRRRNGEAPTRGKVRQSPCSPRSVPWYHGERRSEELERKVRPRPWGKGPQQRGPFLIPNAVRASDPTHGMDMCTVPRAIDISRSSSAYQYAVIFTVDAILLPLLSLPQPSPSAAKQNGWRSESLVSGQPS